MVRTRTRSLAGRTTDRLRQDRGLRVLTALAMVAFVVAVYAIVVIGAGAVLQRNSPSVWLSVLATAIVAVAFEPVRGTVKRTLARALRRDRLARYEALTRLPSTVTGSLPGDKLPGHMARVLAEGTGAERAEVWLAVHGHLELAATWPPASAEGVAPDAAMGPPAIKLDRPGAAPNVIVDGPRHAVAVRERGELLGALAVVVRDEQHLTPVEERLFAGLAAQSGLMLRVAGLRAELTEQLAQLQQRTADLRRARRDLVNRQDEARQRLERNIHDGAQQELIALLVNLRLAQALLTRAPERGARLLAEQAAATRDTIATLTALSRGLYPRLLTDSGPVAALRAALASGPIPVTLTAAELSRYPTEVEATIYFCCLEAVQNATKHSGATAIEIDVTRSGDLVEFTVTDNGEGFDPASTTHGGLANLRDRVESAHGTLTVTSERGRGTTVHAVLQTGAGEHDSTGGPAGHSGSIASIASASASVGGG